MPTMKIKDRSPGDCMRLSVSAAYLIDYAETPNPPVDDAAAFWAAWEPWPATRGLRWWKSETRAPVFLRRWLAIVDRPGLPERYLHVPGMGFHAVAMGRDRLLLDPAKYQGTGRHFYREVRQSDVRAAMALIPADADLPDDATYWPTTRKQNLVRLEPPNRERNTP